MKSWKVFFLGIGLSLLINNAFATVIYTPIEGQQIQAKASPASIFSEVFARLDKIKAPTQFMKQAATRLKSVVFKQLPEDTYGAYNPLLDTMYFPLEMRDAKTGGLIPFDQMSEVKLSTIYHEMWHAYLDLVAKPSNNEIYKTWLAGANGLYRDHGSQFHDEAYGIFIGEILINYLQMWDVFKKRDATAREKLRQSLSLKKIYEDGFKIVVRGYYYDMWRRVFVNSTVNLPDSERTKIVEVLLLNRPPFDYLQAFPEEIFGLETLLDDLMVY